MNETPTQSPQSVIAWRIMVVLVLLLIVVGAFRACGSDRNSQSATPTRRSVTSEEFTIVRNDCGLCGTNSPVGGWETEDGRALILGADGGFTAFFSDDTTMSGTWEQSGDSLCLSPATGGQTCYSYRQLVDAMKLDDAIYIRN